jgi:hypothetical protein
VHEIPLGNGGIALVDDCDINLVSGYTWTRTNKGYARTGIAVGKGKRRYIHMHRLVSGLPSSVHLDHKDGNRLNNCRDNLRPCTQSQNQANRRKVAGSSQYKGVTWNQGCRKWQAAVKKDGKNFYLGLFSDEAQAALAYKVAATELHGEFAHSNAPGAA